MWTISNHYTMKTVVPVSCELPSDTFSTCKNCNYTPCWKCCLFSRFTNQVQFLLIRCPFGLTMTYMNVWNLKCFTFFVHYHANIIRIFNTKCSWGWWKCHQFWFCSQIGHFEPMTQDEKTGRPEIHILSAQNCMAVHSIVVAMYQFGLRWWTERYCHL